MIERREFLKSLLAVIALPLTTTLTIPTKDSIDVPVDDSDDVWEGIKIKYLGKVEVKGCDDKIHSAYRYYLTKEYKGETCYGLCDIDAELCEAIGEYNKADFIKGELRMMAETIQMECKGR